MFAALRCGQCCCLLPFLFGCFGACFEAVAVVAGLQNMTAMGEAIEQRGCHFGVAKHACPFAEAQICGYDDAGAFIEFAEKVEEHGATRGAEWQIPQLVQH